MNVASLMLGVNVDHVATIRQARRTVEPDPVWAAVQAELAGADQITIHLREDRRHIQDRDLEIMRKTVRTRLNLELAASEEIMKIALNVKPDRVTFVPEKREEVTTEGGLDVAGNLQNIGQATRRFNEAGIDVSLFIDPDETQINASAEAGARAVELHTGKYADAKNEKEMLRQLEILESASRLAANRRLEVYAGHGLTYQNVGLVCRIPEIVELNIGHSIISRAIFTGVGEAVREMKRIMLEERPKRERR